jgi:hypothetical protein
MIKWKLSNKQKSVMLLVPMFLKDTKTLKKHFFVFVSAHEYLDS